MSQQISRRGLVRASLATLATGALAATGTAHAAEAKKVYDVIVVGCGCAGMAAAIEAKRAGASVAILEKMDKPAGNTIFAGGHFSACETYVQKRDNKEDSVEQLYQDMMAVSKDRGDPALTMQYCKESGPAIQWLTDACGVQWKPIVTEVFPGRNHGHVVSGALKPGGAQLSKQMLDTCRKLGVEILFDTKVIELTRDELLACTGVKAISEEDGALEFVAKGGVVLATGGFHANKELVARYMGGDTAWMPIRGATTLTGENIILTQPFFPMMVNLDQFHGGPIHGPTRANPSTCVNYGIVLNKRGERILDEVNTYVAVAKMLPKLTPDNWAFIMMDDQVSGIETVKVRLDRYKRAKAPIYTGSTVAEAAKAAGLPVAQVEAVVRQYNDAVRAGKAARLTPPNTLEAPRLLEKAPFYILPFQGGMTATFGGPKIDSKARMLNTENRPIAGLYAAGNALGGIFYDDYIVGSQLTAAVIFGRIAGREAAGRAKK